VSKGLRVATEYGFIFPKKNNALLVGLHSIEIHRPVRSCS